MTGKLVRGEVHPMHARLGALCIEVERVTGERPDSKRGMQPEEFEQSLLKSLRDGKLDPAIRPRPRSDSIVVD